MVFQCRHLSEVREHIDRLDEKIAGLISERSGYVMQAAMLKNDVADVVVPERIEQVISNVRRHASENSADPDLMEHIYRSMINAFIDYERRQWDRIHS